MSEPFLTQARFPRFWVAFQRLFHDDKERIIRRYYRAQKRVLEVGCSVGNMSAVFRDLDCEFVGVDIDKPAIDFAEKTYAAYPRMKFFCLDLNQADDEFGQFDLVMFNGMCHHADQQTLEKLFQKAKALLAPGGEIIVSDPIIPDHPTWLKLEMIKLDRGTFHRTSKDLIELLSSTEGMRIVDTDRDDIRIGLVKWPTVAEYLTIRLIHSVG